MHVIVNLKSHTCHKPDCPQLRTANPENTVYMKLKKAESIKCDKCKYCMGLGIYVKSVEPTFGKYEDKYHMQIEIVDDHFVYIKTKIGFWKIYLNYELGKLQLFHLNEFSDDLTFEELKHGIFHRQSDVKATDSIVKILNYIGEHDRAKPIMEKNYRDLPRNTKRKRKYYQIAKKKEFYKEQQRINELFELIKA